LKAKFNEGCKCTTLVSKKNTESETWEVGQVKGNKVKRMPKTCLYIS